MSDTDKFLSEIEREIVKLRGHGMPTKQIAHTLKRSPRTIDCHIDRITIKARSRGYHWAKVLVKKTNTSERQEK